jgi:hypothetical protein
MLWVPPGQTPPGDSAASCQAPYPICDNVIRALRIATETADHLPVLTQRGAAAEVNDTTGRAAAMNGSRVIEPILKPG